LRFNSGLDGSYVGQSDRRVIDGRDHNSAKVVRLYGLAADQRKFELMFSSIKPGETIMFELWTASTTCWTETLWPPAGPDRS